MYNTSTVKGRRKIELSPGSDTSFSFRIVDSLCNFEEDNPRERTSLDSCTSDDFIEICLSSDKKETRPAETVDPLDNGIELVETYAAHYPPKSVSGTVIKLPHSPSSSESDSFSSTSSRTRFSPIRQMFDPFSKSKAENVKTSMMENTRRNKTFRKSLLCDFLNAEFDPYIVRKNDVHSPVHLHGHLKLGAKHGVPFFEFSVNETEDVFQAKALKADNGFNWVYTFHSVSVKKKSNASIRGSSDSSKDAASIIAQMQVSCRLCSEITDDNSMVTEFVLYDTARARQHATRCYKSDDGSKMVRLKDHLNHAFDSDEVELLNRPPAGLNPNLEIIAIVIQVPFKNRESLTYKRGDKIDNKRHLNLLGVSMIEERKSKIQDNTSREKVKVVIPKGNHSFPCAESRGPSSLLNRWRMGGGCDCGGWDMACPLVVLGNPGLDCFEDRPLVDSDHPFQLFIQGTKENTSALTMKVIEGGYAVDFHAKLSALQAFSICVAILPCTQISSCFEETEGKHLSQCKSLIKAVTKEEEKVGKKVEAIPSSYTINPPFSPISRV